MAIHALNTGASKRAPNLAAILVRLEPVATPLALSSADRAWVGDMIETLIAVLDCADGDADREHDDLDRCTAGEDGPARNAYLDAHWSNAA